MKNDINKRAMLVTLKMKKFGLLKTNDKIKNEYSVSKGVSVSALRTSIELLDDRYVRPLIKSFNAVRTFHYSFSLPFEVGKERILSTKAHSDYTKGYNDLRDIAMAEKIKFLGMYGEALRDAEDRLHCSVDGDSLFDPSLYPTLDQMTNDYWTIDVEFGTIPDSDHIFLHLPKATIDKIKLDTEAMLQRKVNVSLGDLRDQLKDRVDETIKRLGKTKVRKGALDLIGRFADDIAKFDMFDDDAIFKVANLGKTLAASTDGELISDDDDERKRVVDKLNELKDSVLL